ncbi:MAG: hypothetical protein AAF988_06335 [Pseudomonadota bacterium]
MHYLNSVLLPPSDIAKRLVEYAQEHCATVADNYCLSDQVLPHITLCQFQADDISIFQDIEIKSPIDIELKKSNIREGDGIHNGYAWFELEVTKSEALVALQGKVAQTINERAGNISTRIGNGYHPHLTFCRTQFDKMNYLKSLKVPKKFLGLKKNYNFEIGYSDENGQYFGSLS